ncbi:MAG TPA: MerR family transcriptional regulator, partial [Terracidiphilus sp.]|nr:MerR family transcriptional regulator [Terracidiphilus sp.]
MIQRDTPLEKWDPVEDFASQGSVGLAYTASRAALSAPERALADDMATQLSRKRVQEPPAIPDRLYFKIGDVARICKVETYVLRFWESQFPQLKPNKSGTGQRLYRRRDVEMALEIKRLVHGEGYTLSGARHALGEARRKEHQPRLPLAAGEPGARLDAAAAVIGSARAELREIAGLLASPRPQPPRRRPRVGSLHAPSDSLFPS